MGKYDGVELILDKLCSGFLFNQDSLTYLSSLGIDINLYKKQVTPTSTIDAINFIYKGVSVGEIVFLEDVLTAKDWESISHKHSKESAFRLHFTDDENTDMRIYKIRRDILKVIERYHRGCYLRLYPKRYCRLVPIEYAFKLYPHWK